MKFTSRGFTLVELMIVIAIIGILAAALFPSLTAYLKRSRDAGRAANMNTIATSLGAYYSDTERYPIFTAAPGGCVHSGILNTNYLPKGVPVDPTSQKNNGCGANSYYAAGSTGQVIGSPSWVMVAVLENTNGGNYTGTTVPTGFTGVMATGSTNIAAILNKGSGAVFVMTN